MPTSIQIVTASLLLEVATGIMWLRSEEALRHRKRFPPLTFALRVDASLAIGEIGNKVSRKVCAGVLDSLELDDPGSKLQ